MSIFRATNNNTPSSVPARRTFLRATAATTMSLMLLSSCSSADDTTTPAKQWPVLDVAVSDNEYSPANITVHVGQSVRWTYGGRSQHDLKIDEGVDGFGISLEEFSTANATYTFAFTKKGTFIYYCTIHGTKKGGGMAGTIKVTK